MSRVWLHVYDLDEAPSGLAAIGLGAYHSAVQIGDREYAYGACDHGTGVWAGTPKQAEGFKYKKSVDLGVCMLSEVETNRVLGLMHQNWAGDEYDLLTHNCNHFSAALAKALGCQEVPSWVNRAARWGAGLTNVFGRPKALEKPASVAAQHSRVGAALMEGVVQVEKRPGVWKPRYCVLDEHGKLFVFESAKHRATGNASDAAHVLQLPEGDAQYNTQDDGQIEVRMPHAKVMLKMRCEQTAHMSRDEVQFAWSQSLQRVLEHPSDDREPPDHEWSCSACTMINQPGCLDCIICGSAAPSGATGATENDIERSRVFNVVAPEGIAYRSCPQYEARMDHVDGPSCNDLVVSEQLRRSVCGTVFAKCATGIGWVPLTKGPGGRALLEELGQPGSENLTAADLLHVPVWMDDATFNGESDHVYSELTPESLPEGADGVDVSLSKYVGMADSMAQDPPPTRSTLDHEWQVHHDPTTGHDYYHNIRTGQTVWERPDGGVSNASKPVTAPVAVPFSPKAGTVAFASPGQAREQVSFNTTADDETPPSPRDEMDAPPSPRGQKASDNASQQLYPSLPTLK